MNFLPISPESVSTYRSATSRNDPSILYTEVLNTTTTRRYGLTTSPSFDHDDTSSTDRIFSRAILNEAQHVNWQLREIWRVGMICYYEI